MFENQSNQELGPPDDLNELNTSWTISLEKFKKYHYPIFEKYGFKFSEAYILWRMNMLYNELTPEEDNEGDEWKRR